MMITDEELKPATKTAAHSQFFLRQQPKTPTIDMGTAHAAIVLSRAVAKMTPLHLRKTIETRCAADGLATPEALDELVHSYLAHASQVAALASEATTVSYWLMINMEYPLEDLVKGFALTSEMVPLPPDTPFSLACPRQALLAAFNHLSAPTRARKAQAIS